TTSLPSSPQPHSSTRVAEGDRGVPIRGMKVPRTVNQEGIDSRPEARARSRQSCNTSRRSTLSMRPQRVISAAVRWQPMQISSSSSAQTCTQGERTGFSTSLIVRYQLASVALRIMDVMGSAGLEYLLLLLGQLAHHLARAAHHQAAIMY